jgi:hypothetical protein
MCHVCKKYDHDALHCRQHFNHAYQPNENCERTGNVATNPTYIVDTNWYLDNSANDYLTSNLECLSVHDRYTGKDTV